MSVLNQIPIGVEDRLCKLSANEEMFNRSAEPYQAALENAGYDYKIKFTERAHSNKKCRKRKIIWLYPLFHKGVATNIGKKFLTILNEYFPKGHKLYKIFIINSVKISYSCLPNMGARIAGLNKEKLKKASGQAKDEIDKCKCRK